MSDMLYISTGFQYDPNDEDNYDFQFAKWMMREKVNCFLYSVQYWSSALLRALHCLYQLRPGNYKLSMWLL